MKNERFSTLMAMARAGDAAAVAQLLKVFEHDLKTIIRVQLPRLLRTKYDSMDFVQAVWASLFTGPSNALGEFESIRHFRSYLAAVARNKILAEFRRRTRTGKYNMRREEPLFIERNGCEQPRDFTSAEPTPSQQLQAQDRLVKLTAGRTPFETRVIELRRGGLTFEEIAANLGVHERTVRRVVDALRKRLEEEPDS